ncbi:MAG: NUDIX hydrolase [Spirochaetota bacterium]|nr:NUDIX hydrolase [Spirochaetota bacterium]
MKKNLIEKQLESNLLHKGHFFNLYKDKVLLPNERFSYREYITHPKAVVVLPLFPNGKIILIKQYRYPLKKVFIEVPAGKLDSNETIEEAANRELLEETGYSSNKLSFISTFYPCIGYSNEEMNLFLAEDLSLKEQSLDHDEFVEPMIMHYSDAMNLIESGQITDLKTLYSLLSIYKYVFK